MQLPKMYKVTQKSDETKISEIKTEVLNEVRKSKALREIKPGAKIAVTAGSRGIANIVLVLQVIVSELKKLGAEPFIVPAMGSHGGGQAKGQIQLLKSLGITKESIGAPISTSNEVVEIGDTDGVKVFIDKKAYESDGIFVVNRVKPHTSFRGEIESGLLKMLVIGLGKKEGADNIHQLGVDGLKKFIPKVGQIITKKAPVLFGIALVENGYEELAIIKGIEPNNFIKEERELLKKAKKFLPTLPFDKIDLLVVQEMGKCYSGTGMDTNVIGRVGIRGQEEPKKPDIKRLVVLDLAEASHGNANGIGLADLTTKKLVEKIDYKNTYTNILATTFFQRAMIPVTLKNDEEAIITAIDTLRDINIEQAKIVWIENTLHIREIWVSEKLKDEAEGVKDLIIDNEGKKFVFKKGELENFKQN